jgi:hypothetical protein
MPELFRFFGMSFFFYSLEHLPIHIHVRNAEGTAKFDVEPQIRLVESKGMKTKDLALAEAIIEEKKEEIIAQWKKFHGE